VNRCVPGDELCSGRERGGETGAEWPARLFCAESNPMALGFVHLHLHSAYSLLEGALPLARILELATADRQPAVALTDTNNMFGALEFSAKMAGAGIQPIVGCALSIDCGDQEQHQPR
jgi:hypothetical protein